MNFTECSVWSELWDSTGLKETGERVAAVFFLTARIWSRALNAGAAKGERKVRWGKRIQTSALCISKHRCCILTLQIKSSQIHLATKKEVNICTAGLTVEAKSVHILSVKMIYRAETLYTSTQKPGRLNHSPVVYIVLLAYFSFKNEKLLKNLPSGSQE